MFELSPEHLTGMIHEGSQGAGVGDNVFARRLNYVMLQWYPLSVLGTAVAQRGDRNAFNL